MAKKDDNTLFYVLGGVALLFLLTKKNNKAAPIIPLNASVPSTAMIAPAADPGSTDRTFYIDVQPAAEFDNSLFSDQQNSGNVRGAVMDELRLNDAYLSGFDEEEEY